jgi:hypothetical protein
MALPLVLIHGYSTEGKTADGGEYASDAVAKLYGRLPSDLRNLGANIVPINVGRYVSLDDGVDLEDLALSFDRVLSASFPELKRAGFNAIIHSTGALVARNWIRRHTNPGACPMKRLIHLAGANLGSGWAHVGGSQFAKFARMVQGVQRGMGVLGGLELGSSWAIDLHTHFLQPGFDMFLDYGVMEFCMVGSQVPPEYFIVPVRYGKEDGSDGVVRVSASNLNFNYAQIAPTAAAPDVDWDQATAYTKAATKASLTGTPGDDVFKDGYYHIDSLSGPGRIPERHNMPVPGASPRVQIPFAVPYGTSHSDMKSETAIVDGDKNRQYVLPLIQNALASTPATYAESIATFDAATKQTYDLVRNETHAQGLLARLGQAIRDMFDNPEGQYDRHSQLTFRVRDQNGQPVNDFSVYFNSYGGSGTPSELINKLFEDKHKNERTPNSICFYLRVEAWDRDLKDWVSRLSPVDGVSLEIDAIDPTTQRVMYLPVRMQLSAPQLAQWIQPHRTTIVDVVLLRLPHKVTFILRDLG